MAQGTVFALLGGVTLAIIAAVAFLYQPSNAYQNSRRQSAPKVKKCSKCNKILTGSNDLTLICAHQIHEECLYSVLITQGGKKQKYSCPECGKEFPDNFWKNQLSSRCCLCKKEWDLTTSKVRLSCGHRLHKKCLEDTFIGQQFSGTSSPGLYKCPYDLLECNQTWNAAVILNMIHGKKEN